MRSWELIARYVVPEINGYVRNHAGVGAVRARQQGRADGGRQPAAVMSKIMSHEGATKAMATTMEQLAAQAAGNAAEADTAFRPGAGLPTT